MDESLVVIVALEAQPDHRRGVRHVLARDVERVGPVPLAARPAGGHEPRRTGGLARRGAGAAKWVGECVHGFAENLLELGLSPPQLVEGGIVVERCEVGMAMRMGADLDAVTS